MLKAFNVGGSRKSFSFHCCFGLKIKEEKFGVSACDADCNSVRFEGRWESGKIYETDLRILEENHKMSIRKIKHFN